MPRLNSGVVLASPQPSKVLACSARRPCRPVPLGKMSARSDPSEVKSPRTRAWMTYGTFVGLGGIVLFSLQLLSPMLRHYIVREGGILENLSATFYLFAILVGAWACFRARPEIRRRYAAIPILAALAFYDEISDGIFMEPVLEFRGIKLTAFHEWIHAGYNLWRDLDPPWAKFLVLVLVAAIAGALAVRYRARLRAALSLLKRDTSYQLVVIGIGQAAIALVLDRQPEKALRAAIDRLLPEDHGRRRFMKVVASSFVSVAAGTATEGCDGPKSEDLDSTVPHDVGQHMSVDGCVPDVRYWEDAEPQYDGPEPDAPVVSGTVPGSLTQMA